MPGTPTLDQYVDAYRLMAMRAPLKQRTTFTPAGKTVVHESGERILYGPKGEKIRVIEHPGGATQIEHGDHLHGIVRPKTYRVRMSLDQAQAFASAVGHPQPIRTTMTPKGPQ
jgi:hypothetical protein